MAHCTEGIFGTCEPNHVQVDNWPTTYPGAAVPVDPAAGCAPEYGLYPVLDDNGVAVSCEHRVMLNTDADFLMIGVWFLFVVLATLVALLMTQMARR